MRLAQVDDRRRRLRRVAGVMDLAARLRRLALEGFEIEVEAASVWSLMARALSRNASNSGSRAAASARAPTKLRAWASAPCRRSSPSAWLTLALKRDEAV
jgi:hypothetical protein